MISLAFLTTTAFCNELPDFCKTGEFSCHQAGPNYVIAYPANQSPTDNQKEIKVSGESIGENVNNPKETIDVDLSNLTWSAYDSNGELMRSGRISSGKEYCPDIGKNCETITGIFTIFRKGDESCKSTIYPIGRGGAPMPYCMFFHGGYALHGSKSVPNYNASHGCVRMSPEDAEWLNETFAIEGVTKVHTHY